MNSLRKLLFSRRRRWVYSRALLLALLLPLASLSLAQLRFFELLELKTEDLRYRIRGTREVRPEILLVEIDDHTIEEYGGKYPLDRHQHAILLDGLIKAGARTVAFDLLFTTPSANPRNDILFGHFLQANADQTILVSHFEGLRRDPAPVEIAPSASLIASATPAFQTYAGARADLPDSTFLQSGAGLGHITLLPEIDDSIRKVPLLIRGEGGYLPALALQAWLRWAGHRVSDLEVDSKGQLLDASGQLVLQLPKMGVHEIDYAGGPSAFAEHRISYMDALNLIKQAHEELPAAVAEVQRRCAGRIVLVALTAPNSYSVDLGVTPFGAATPLPYAHANLLDDLLSGSGVQRVGMLFQLTIASLLIFLATLLGARMKAGRLIALLLLVILVGSAVAQLLFSHGSLMLDVVPGGGGVLLGILAVAGLSFVGQEGERQILKRTFERYVSPDLLEGILQDAGKLRLGGELRLATVIFVDIRGFTSWTQTMDPRELVDELNEFLSEMVEVVFEHEGSVNKFMGDAVLAIFGAPLQQPDDASHAVAAACAMQGRLEAHNRERESEGKLPLRMGIGIATGPVVAGNVGSSQRLEYTVIGNAVNLSARLQAFSRDGQLLADAATVWALREQGARVEIESIGEHELKGMHAPVEIFQVRSRSATPSTQG